LRPIAVAFVPGPTSPLLVSTLDGLARHFQRRGHRVQTTPDDNTTVILTTAPLGEPLDWRQSLFFTARKRFHLRHNPTIYTLIQIHPDQFQGALERLQAVLTKEPPHPADYAFPGLAPQAYRTLFEQGRRGGPILALERVIQAQAKCLHVILVVGEDRPQVAYHFDLVGASPRSEAADLEAFYEDIVLRIVTTVSTTEVNRHEVVGQMIPRDLWQRLTTPEAMAVAGRQLGERHFFTEMVRIADLVAVPVVPGAIASQYSEGCFATWDPVLGVLIATVTGSARPVDKDKISEDELAVIVGVRPDRMGALVRHVAGKRNDPPSTEALEMVAMDEPLPRVTLGPEWGIPATVPVVRSKLHGHRGIAAYDPSRVEFVPLDEPYYRYLVTCGTDAQAEGIRAAFARSRALQHPADPRQVVFTVLPGHGCVIVEKWSTGKVPFQMMWEYMDAGYLQVSSTVPQGMMTYQAAAGGQMAVVEGKMDSREK